MPTRSPRAVAGLAMLSLGFFDGILGVAWLGVYVTLNTPIESLGWVLAAVGLGSALGSAIAPLALTRWGHLALLVTALSCQALCMLVMGLSHTLWVFVLLYGVRGVVNGMAHATLNAFFAPRISARHLMNVHGGWGLGTATAGLIAGTLMAGGWPWFSIYLIGVGISGVAALWVYRSATRLSHLQAQTALEGLPSSMLRGPVIALILGSAVYVGLEQGVGNWLSTVVVNIGGVQLGTAGAMTATFWGGLTVGRFVLNRLPGNEVQVLKWSALSVFGLLLGFMWLPVVGQWIAIGLVGLSMAPIAPFVLTVVSRAVPSHRRDAVMAWQILGFSVGAATVPALYGVVADAFTLGAVPIAFAVSAALLLGLFWPNLKRVH